MGPKFAKKHGLYPMVLVDFYLLFKVPRSSLFWLRMLWKDLSWGWKDFLSRELLEKWNFWHFPSGSKFCQEACTIPHAFRRFLPTFQSPTIIVILAENGLKPTLMRMKRTSKQKTCRKMTFLAGSKWIQNLPRGMDYTPWFLSIFTYFSKSLDHRYFDWESSEIIFDEIEKNFWAEN